MPIFEAEHDRAYHVMYDDVSVSIVMEELTATPLRHGDVSFHETDLKNDIHAYLASDRGC